MEPAIFGDFIFHCASPASGSLNVSYPVTSCSPISTRSRYLIDYIKSIAWIFRSFICSLMLLTSSNVINIKRSLPGVQESCLALSCAGGKALDK